MSVIGGGIAPGKEFISVAFGHRLCENYFRKMKVGNTALIYIRIDRKVGIRMQNTV
jgi:hypothetical protein